MTKRTAIACLFGTAAFLQPLHGRCQDENVAWTTHVELRQWIPTGEGAEGHVEELTEGGRAFLRLRPPWFWMMRSREAHQLLVPGDIAPLLELHEYNTVRVVVRSTLTTGTIGGFWTHVNTEYDENLQGIPHFSQHTLAGDAVVEAFLNRLRSIPATRGALQTTQPRVAFASSSGRRAIQTTRSL